MQASRASSRTFKAVAAGSRQTRNLSITGPATFSSLLTSERPALNLPRDLAGLRAECQKRKLPVTGSIEELTSRLSAHEITNSRPFSTAVRSPRRPVPSSTETSAAVRHFNTSRTLKTVKDSSTIDFAYIPDFDPNTRSAPANVRVPILPHTIMPKMAADEEVHEVMIPTIYTASADSTHIHAPAAMAEVTDSDAVDFQGIASHVADSFSKPVEEGAGMARQILRDMMEDILGSKAPARA